MTHAAPTPASTPDPGTVPHRATAEGDLSHRDDRPLAGIGYMLLAVALFSVMDTFAKALTPHFPVAQILVFRAAGALLIVLPLAWRLGGGGRALVRQARGAALKLLIAGLLGAGALASFLMAWRTLSLIEVAAILFTAPLIVTALSVPLLRESVGLHRWSAVVVGFIGALIILRPGGAVFGGAALWAMLGALCYALWMISLRMAGKAVPSSLVTTSNALLMLVLALPFAVWVWTPASAGQGLALLSVGVIGGLAQLSLTRAFSLAPAALVAPFDYSYILYGTALDLAVFALFPGAGTWMGLSLITAAGLYVIHRERVVARRRRAAEASRTSP